MTDKVIRVNVTSSKSQKVTVSSSKVANEITASPDTSAYYSRLAKNWAIAEGLVENIDYSSKHYAQESKASADMAKTYEISTQENYNMFMEASINANSELQTNRDGALADIEGAKTSAIDSLNSVKDENIASIEAKGDSLTSEITSLSNGYISQINTTGKSYDNLTHRNITNCITEIPQRIKYTLEDGTLTIKAGSVVIVPYGTKDQTSQFPVGSRFLHDNFKVYDTQFADGKFFVWVEVRSDIVTTASTSMGNGLYMFGVKPETNNFSGRLANAQQGSGDGSNIKANDMYYHTGTNAITTYLNGTNEDINCSFPLFLINKDDTGYTSIDQVFNGMGFIGSTIWVDKGVKGLIPNGRNEDGSLKNIEVTTDKLLQFQVDWATPNVMGDVYIFNDNTITISNISKTFYTSETPTVTQSGYNIWYNPNTNLWKKTTDGGLTWETLKQICVARFSIGSTAKQITKLNTIDTVDLLKRNDKSEISGWGMPSNKSINLTLGASGTKYTAPANGWVSINKTATAANQNLNIGTNGLGYLVHSSSASQWLGLTIPIQKGRSFYINYTANGATNSFNFVYAQGEV